MRRRIELYIGGKLADLDEQGFLLYNYAFTDLEKPSTVKNSFSKQVKLPATPRNLAIFGHAERTDRAVGSGSGTTGMDFNPGWKTPFELRDELQTILESGYLRLDSVTMKGRTVTGLKVTLFGGIGSFFYNLSYNQDGTKKTLADLNYGITLGSFYITASHINACWSRLRTHDQGDGIANAYDVVNFAPAYNGIPEGQFSPDKGLVVPSSSGLADEQVDGGKTYRTQGSYALVNLKSAKDEWACKDLRSYLQRPVLSMTAFLQAIARAANNGGFTVDISQIPTSTYVNVWKTLQEITNIGGLKSSSGEVDLVKQQLGQQITYLGAATYDGSVPIGSSVTGYATFRIAWTLPSMEPVFTPVMVHPWSEAGAGGNLRMVVFAQLVAMRGNLVISAFPAKCLCDNFGKTAAQIASFVGYTPLQSAGFWGIQEVYPIRGGGPDYNFSDLVSFYFSGRPASEYVLQYACYVIKTTVSGSTENMTSYTRYNSMITMGTYNDQGTDDGFDIMEASNIAPLSVTGYANYTTTTEVRSGANIPYATLLHSEYTPAEYLIAFCKANGLVFSYNPAGKEVAIIPRDDWFSGEITDLSGRVDRSKEITITPLFLKAKWYELKGGIVEGAMAAEYKEKYGNQYGAQRVNTGYDFDASTDDLMSGLALKGAVTILDHGSFWNAIIDQDDNIVPSVFLEAGGTYTLWDDDGESKNFQIPIPAGDMEVEYYNSVHGYDIAYYPKLEFRDASNKAQNGADVLCRYVGSAVYNYFEVTDDTETMLAMNNGKPCWWLTKALNASVNLPIFHRYNALDSSHEVTRSLDYGIPQEVDIPGVTFDLTAGSLYLRAWRAYLSDLLNMNTKVMKCRVDLGGLQVGPELLRRFYWYEGSLWVLNKITNYSLTTWDPTECEFVQVQDMSNYTNGQNL